MKKIIKKLLLDFYQEWDIKEIKKRDIEIPLDSGKIITIIGPRRSGKSYMLYSLMKKLISQNKKENIIYINFEDERLNFKRENLSEIIDAYLEIFPSKDLKEVYFFFDEIQNIDSWERFVRRIYDQYSKNIYITGSSSKLLSKEISTSLRGRTVSYEVYPLSFKEHLNFKGIDFSRISTRTKARINQEFEEYIKYGGFPELHHIQYIDAYKILQEYVNVMMYKDLIERHDLSRPNILKFIIKKIFLSYSKEFSINKTYNDLKSMGLKISKDLVYEYVHYIDEVFFFFFVNRYDKNLLNQEKYNKKVYIIDNGLINAVSFKFSEDKGRLLENLVFIELKRRGKEIYYHKNKKECDFVIKQGLEITEAIQVTTSLEDPETKKRELQGLIDALKIYSLKQGLILTEDEEHEFIEKDKKTGKEFKIIVKPIWKFLLQ